MKSIVRLVCSLLCLLSLLCAIWPPRVYADGGAPQLAYIAGAAQGLSVIDIAQRRPTSTFALDGQPHMILLSLDGSALYVTQPTLERVAIIATRTHKIICTAHVPGQPSLLAVSVDASVLYVAGRGDTSVRALNPTTCALEHTFEAREPINGLAVAASTEANATPATPNQVWITGNSGLTVFDATGRLLGTAAIAGGPQYISIPAGFTAYITTLQGSLLAVDLSTRRVIRTLISGGAYGPMDYDATTGDVYVPDHLHNTLAVVTPVTANTAVMPREPVRQYSLDSAPQSIAVTSDGQLGFVALANGQVVMLDIPGRRIITSIVVGGTPRFVITGLYPPVNVASAVTPQNITTSMPGLSAGLIGLCLILVLLGMGILAVYWLFWRRSRV